jgi:hypothetical protein
MLQLSHVLFRGGFFGEIPRQHEFGFEHSPARLNPAIKSCGCARQQVQRACGPIEVSTRKP